jgi:uncharacterized protein (TIGR02453 family)
VAPFTGWGVELQQFFTGLEKDNSKTYFNQHRELYQRAVREPTEALLATLEPRYGTGRIFRVNRDIRFATDKRPYHVNTAVQFAGSGTHYYVSVSATELITSIGVFRADKDWVLRYRSAVNGSAGSSLLKIVEQLESQGFTIGGSELKAVPHGYSPDHPNARLLRHRAMTASQHWPPSVWLGRPSALELIVDAWEQASDFSDWLCTYTPIGG